MALSGAGVRGCLSVKSPSVISFLPSHPHHRYRSSSCATSFLHTLNDYKPDVITVWMYLAFSFPKPYWTAETHLCTSCTKLKSFNRIFIPSLQCSLQTLWSMLYKASLQTIVFLLSWTRVQYEKWQKEKRRKDNESLIMLFPAKGKQNLRFICLNCESKTQKGAFTLTLQDLFITLWADISPVPMQIAWPRQN